jgi:c-di-AMP phosphodiesterase-like protein
MSGWAPSDLLHEEAEALLAGIVLDTKHFTMRTRRAAPLRRRRSCAGPGADTSDVQRLFQNDLSEVTTRYDIMRRAKVVHDSIAVVTVEEDGVDRVAAAQAADELLTLKGIRASFVLYRAGKDVMMCCPLAGRHQRADGAGGAGRRREIPLPAGGRVENGDPDAVRGGSF